MRWAVRSVCRLWEAGQAPGAVERGMLQVVVARSVRSVEHHQHGQARWLLSLWKVRVMRPMQAWVWMPWCARWQASVQGWGAWFRA